MKTAIFKTIKLKIVSFFNSLHKDLIKQIMFSLTLIYKNKKLSNRKIFRRLKISKNSNNYSKLNKKAFNSKNL
jgi:hypothetical protein